jgi:hypothetical protein
MKQLVFSENLDHEAQQQVLVELVVEGMESLAELENLFPGFREVDIETVESIASDIFKSLRHPSLVLEEPRAYGENPQGLCAALNTLKRRVNGALRPIEVVSEQADTEFGQLGFTRRMNFETNSSEIRFNKVPLEILRPLFASFLLLCQRTNNSAFDGICKSLAAEEDFTLDMIKSYDGFNEAGSHHQQLHQTMVNTPTKIRKTERFQSGIKALALIAMRVRGMSELPEVSFEKPVQKQVEVVLKTEAEITAEYLQQSLDKFSITRNQLPKEKFLRTLFEAKSADDIKRILTSIVRALKVPTTVQRNVKFKQELMEWYESFEVFNDESISYEALLWEVIYWVEQSAKVVEAYLKDEALKQG